MCVRVAIDLGLFELIVEHDSSKGRISAKELAERSQAEQLLIGNWLFLHTYQDPSTEIEIVHSPHNASSGRDGICDRR